MADNKREGKKKEKGSEIDQTFNLQRRQTSERVIFQPTAVTDIKREKRERQREIEGDEGRDTGLFDYQILLNCKM